MRTEIPEVLIRIIRTCKASPSQWNAWDAKGRYWYLRYRDGRGTMGPDYETMTECFYADDRPDSLISIGDFLRRLGVAFEPAGSLSLENMTFQEVPSLPGLLSRDRNMSSNETATEGVTVKKATDKIWEAWNENPLAVIGVAAGVIIATAKLLDSVTAMQNARSWKKEVNRRDRKNRK
jgi:hypothetical protein